MYRLLQENLALWKANPRRKPLLLRGARQVGKTWLVREHAKQYPLFLEVNLEERHHLAKYFRNSYGDPQQLVRVLEVEFGQKIDVKSTLLFLDEVQTCPESLLSLRYFKEKLPELHLIASGSLLEFAIKEISFPVGRIDFLHLFPMNFEEFLIALNRNDLLSFIATFSQIKDISEHEHAILCDLLNKYLLIGGMPAVVQTYIDSGFSFIPANSVKQNLVTSIREDFYKYASRAKIEYLRRVFDSIPLNLGKKVKYTNIDRESKSRELQSAFMLLRDASIIHLVHHTSANGLPLNAEIDTAKFKAYLHDTGLCTRMMSPPKEDWQALVNKGGLAEQFVVQELLSYTEPSSAPELFYWHREARNSNAEVDLIASAHGRILPIEVKSGSNLNSKSLKVFLDEKRNIQHAFKFSIEQYSFRNRTHLLPLYATKALLSFLGEA